MWPFYGAAALIVLVAGSLLVLYRAPAPELQVASVKSTGSPSPPRPAPATSATVAAFVGEAPWALSALPECFEQQSLSRGPRVYVVERIPSGARRVTSGSHLRFADCVLEVGDDDVLVMRGSDKLHVPPHASLYRLPTGQIVLVRMVGGRGELHVYKPKV